MGEFSYPFISWPIIAAILLFIIMILIPFLIALKELFKPKDDAPLYIDMLHSKDPMYFGKAFKRMIQLNIETPECDIEPGMSVIKFSKEEEVEAIIRPVASPHPGTHRLLYVAGDLETAGKASFLKEIYVKGETEIGPRNVLRALYSEKDILIRENCTVSRWVCSERDIAIETGSSLGRSIACNGRLQLDSGCQFQSLFGNPIVTASSNQEAHDFLHSPYPERIPVKNHMEWKIIKKYLSINANFQHNSMTETEYLDLLAQQWDISPERIILPDASIIDYNFATRKPLIIKKNSRIFGSIKAYYDIFIENDVIITGEIFCERDIKIGKNCLLLGSVFSQAGIYAGSRVRIGKPGGMKSVIGKKHIELDCGVVIYGYVLSEGEGKTR